MDSTIYERMADFFIDLNRSKYSNNFVYDVLTYGAELISINVTECEPEILVRIEEIYHDSDPVMGSCYGEGDSWVIEVDSRLDMDLFIETLFHELVHIAHEGITSVEFKEAEATLISSRMKGLWDAEH